MLVYNGMVISWFAFFAAVACAVGITVSCILRKCQNKPVSDIFAAVTFAVPLGLLAGRINYCMFSYESIDSVQDFFSLTNGGFGLYGVIAGAALAVLIVCRFFGGGETGALMDCVATGGSIAIAIGRFATRFTTAEIGYPVKFRLFTVYDSSQNVYNLAVFELDGICEMLVFLTCLCFFFYTLKKYKSSGKAALIMLALHGTNQVVMDSMRADPLKLGMNNFIKISQIIGILCCITILVYFMVITARKKGFGKFHIISIPVILVSILLGVLGEYRVGDSDYITKHLVMFFGMLVLSYLTVAFAVRSVIPAPAAESGREPSGERRRAPAPRRNTGMNPAPQNNRASSPAASRQNGGRGGFNRHPRTSGRPEERPLPQQAEGTTPPASPQPEKSRSFNRHQRGGSSARPANNPPLPDVRPERNNGTGKSPAPIVFSDSDPFNVNPDLNDFNI